MDILKRLKRRDPDYDFFDRFGDPSKPSAGQIPPTTYPEMTINAATQIRVVQVLAGAFEEEVCCRLDVRSLTSVSQAPDTYFSALSYTWGGFSNPGSITLNGSPGFPISQNLCCCLRRLRSMGQEQWLWIDQICINQHDKQEKSLQVPLMTEIYTQAAKVIIWLGEYDFGSQISQSRSYQLDKIIEYASFGRKDMGLCWWRRLWVLQEYCLASKEPVVQIGSEQISWSEVCQFTGKYLEGSRSALPAAKGLGVFNNMIERFNKVREKSLGERTLLALAWVFPQLLCFDPRDKVYGLLGLLAPDLKAMIRPDYEQVEVKGAFSQATYAEISYTKSLGIFALTRRNPMTAGLPSWAVDFVYPQELERMTISYQMEYWLGMFQKSPNAWTCTATQKNADVEYNTENASLTVTGLDFDQILFVSPVINTKSQNEPHVTSWQKMLLATTSLTSGFILKREERDFCRQILAPLETKTAYQRLLSNEKAYSSPLVSKLGPIRRILAEAIMMKWLDHDAHADDECVENEFEDDDVHPSIWEGYFSYLAGDFDTYGSSTSFYVTSKGFVGVGPRHMRAGDQIILPYGSRYPMLLHINTDGAWSFSGFVHVT